VVVILISHLDAHKQAAQSIGAGAFISKSETSKRVIERLRFAVDGLNQAFAPLRARRAASGCGP
jgi:hypothetical protein